MTTAQEIVEDAAALFLVDEENTALDASSSAIMTRFLNDYLSELYSAGVDLGYRPVSSPSDVVTIPAGANLAVKYGLALRCNAIFGLPIPQEVAGLAPGLERRLRSSYMRLPRVKPPRTLPMGTGNQYTVYDISTFYPFSQPEGALRLDTPTTVTINTIDTQEVVIGPWVPSKTLNVNSNNAGDFTYTLDDTYLARIIADLTLTSTNGDTYTFYFTRNGAVIDGSDYEITADRAQNMKFQIADTIRRNDTIELVVENNTGTNDLDISHGHFTLD